MGESPVSCFCFNNHGSVNPAGHKMESRQWMLDIFSTIKEPCRSPCSEATSKLLQQVGEIFLPFHFIQQGFLRPPSFSLIRSAVFQNQWRKASFPLQSDPVAPPAVRFLLGLLHTPDFPYRTGGFSSWFYPCPCLYLYHYLYPWCLRLEVAVSGVPWGGLRLQGQHRIGDPAVIGGLFRIIKIIAGILGDVAPPSRWKILLQIRSKNSGHGRW